MPEILVLRHVAHEHLGSLAAALRRGGISFTYLDLSAAAPCFPDVGTLDGLVIMGGPMNVDQVDHYPFLAREVPFIREALQRGVPALGICLGAQLLARSLGASVYPNDKKEIGWYPVTLTEAGREDPLLAPLGSGQVVFQWHGDTFDLPDGATLLATSALCRHQAFVWRGTAYGLQFHLEVTAPMVEEWLQVPENAAEIQALGGEIDPEAIRGAAQMHLPGLERVGQDAFARFCRMVG